MSGLLQRHVTIWQSNYFSVHQTEEACGPERRREWWHSGSANDGPAGQDPRHHGGTADRRRVCITFISVVYDYLYGCLYTTLHSLYNRIVWTCIHINIYVMYSSCHGVHYHRMHYFISQLSHPSIPGVTLSHPGIPGVTLCSCTGLYAAASAWAAVTAAGRRFLFKR